MAETTKNENVFVVDPSTGAQKFIDLRGLDHFWTKAQEYVDNQNGILGNRIGAVETDLEELQTIVNGMNGTSGSGTIADRIQAAIDALKLDETYEKVGVAETKANAAAAEAKSYADGKVSGMATTLRGEMEVGLAAAKNEAAANLAAAVGAYAVEGDEPVDASGLRGEIAQRDADVLTAAKAYANVLDDAMDARVVKLEAIDHDKLAADAASSAVATVVGGAPQAFDTLKEIADWIQKDTTNENGFDAAARIVALETNKADKTYVDEQYDKLEVRVKALEDHSNDYVTADNNLATTLRGEIATAKGEAVTSANGYTDQKVSALAGTVDTLSGTVASNHTAALKAATDAKDEAIAAAAASVDGKLTAYTTTTEMTKAINAAKAAAIADAQGKIDSLTTVVNGKADKSYVDEHDAAVKVYAATYTDQLFASITFASNADIESIF
jgi:hypothetical protein